MMLYEEWIKTQTGKEQWGTVDPASQAAILRHFAKREIFDDDRMADLFWDDVIAYGPRYMDMLRIEAVNERFDPMVNRYFEAWDRDKRETTDNSTKTGITTGNTSTSGENNSTVTTEGNSSGTDTITYGKVENRDLTNKKTYEGEDSTVYEGITDKRTYDSYAHEKTFTGRERETTRSGQRTETRTDNLTAIRDHNNLKEETTYGDKGMTVSHSKEGTETHHKTGTADMNYEEDMEGSTEKTEHGTNTSQATVREGTFRSEDENTGAGRTKEMAKVPPVNAANFKARGTGTTDGTGAAAEIAYLNQSEIPDADSKFGTSYAENDTRQATVAKHMETYDGDKSTVTNTGTAADNYDLTTYSRKKGTATDITETITYAGWKDSETTTGTGAGKTTTGGWTDTNSGTVETKEVFGTKDAPYKETVTEKGSEKETETGGWTDKKDGKEVRNHPTETTTDNGSITNSGSDSTEHSTENHETVTTEGTDKTTTEDKKVDVEKAQGNGQETRESRNWYTGREGMTPQEGLESAIRYLQSTSAAIRWFYKVLEHNFIMVWD